MNESKSYRHTQRAPYPWWFVTMSLPAFIAAPFFWETPGVALLMTIPGFFLLLLAGAFGTLTVSHEAAALRVAFGPLPSFWRRIPYRQMRSAKVGRTTLLDGWGVHWSLRGGWVINLWGRDCVEIQLKKGKIFVGTDDPRRLAEFLNSRISQAEAA